MFCRSFFVGGYSILAIPTQSNCMQNFGYGKMPYPRNLIVCKLRGWQGCHTYTNYIICI